MADKPVVTPVSGAPAPRCEATILIHDDRFPMQDRCEGPAGHGGPHTASRDACEPTAWLSWVGSYETPVQEDDKHSRKATP